MKKNIGTLRVSIIVVIILLFTNVIPANSLPSMENTAFNETIKLEYNFNAPDIKIVNGYSKLSFEDSCIINNPGEPQIPLKSIKVLVPKNSIEFEISITLGERIILPGVHVITPGQKMYPTNYTGSIEPTSPNPDIYQSENTFPGFSYENIGLQSFRGYDFLTINLYPIQYFPIKGEVYYFDKMNIQISPIISESVENKFFRNINKDVVELKVKIENPDLIGCYEQTKKATNPPSRSEIVNPEDSYDLVIVTKDELKNSDGNYTFQDLIIEKSNIGISATIVTIEEILSCPDYSCNGFWGDGDGFNEMFNDTQAKIRNFIRDAYVNWETEYVLLGGDNSIIPARTFYFGRYHNNDVFGPSDMYYSCLEGNYNSDGDGKWAENLDGMDTPNGNDDVDLVAEVYVGRASIDNSDELDHFINKTITYMNADDPYLNDVLMVGEYLGPEFAADYMDELINESSNNDYYTVGIPADDFSYNISKLYGRDYPGGNWPREELISRINKGQHIINNLGHSGPNLNMRIWPAIFESSITNTKHSFIYSQGCDAGAFEVDDCIAEYFTIKNNHGAFAGIWNARYGWHTGSNSTDSSSQRFHRCFWDAVFGENITVISKANQDSKEDNLGMINGQRIRWAMYGLNLLGDPSLEFKPIWRGEHNICVKRMNLGKNHITTNQTIIVNTTIVNNGLNNERNINIDFIVNEEIIETQIIENLDSLTSQNLSFIWKPEYGVYEAVIEANVDFVEEDLYWDNVKRKIVRVGVWNDDTDMCFGTIQDAIDDSNTLDGHRIVVPIDTYQENVVINKGIILEGENRNLTIIRSIDSENYPIFVDFANSVQISELTISNGKSGVFVESSNNVKIKDIIIKDNMVDGIRLNNSTNSIVSNNIIINSSCGVFITQNANENEIVRNDIYNNNEGIIIFDDSNNNLIYLNHLNNSINAYDFCENQWDNGYFNEFSTGGGNYWSDYNKIDDFSGPNQNELWPDGISDNPYNVFGGISIDRYPLIYYNTNPVINVNTGKDFETIQSAIDDDQTVYGHTILILSGIYQEFTMVNKTINLIGQYLNTTIIDIYGYAIMVTSNYTNICRLSFTNSRGIYIGSWHNTIFGNRFIDGKLAITITGSSSFNKIVGNRIENNNVGSIGIYAWSNNNLVVGNTISNNEGWAVDIAMYSENNEIYHNNFIENAEIANDECLNNYWNAGYPSGGNFWSVHSNEDEFNGPNQDIPGPDGIVDIEFNIPGGESQDQYPWTTIRNPLYANANGPYFGVVNESVQFYGFTFGGELPYIWHWDFGDGSETSDIPNPTHVYNLSGEFEIIFTATDGSGNISTNRTTIHINGGLSAEANGPYIANTTEPIYFNGDVSDGIPPYEWLWDFGDGYTSTERFSIHSYNFNGTYNATLTVIDSQQNIASDSAAVNISLSPLIAEANGPYIAFIEEYIKFRGNASGGSPPYSWHWDFGDGFTSDEQEPMHNFADEGEYTAILTVTDARNVNVNDTARVNIYSSKPKYVWVDDDFDENTQDWGYDHFNIIQEGIDAVTKNGTVYVYNGSYYESLVIDKKIKLIGEEKNATVIDANYYGSVILIYASNVTVKGFTLKNCGFAPGYGGIKILGDNNNILDNLIVNNIEGVIVWSSENNVIRNNYVRNFEGSFGFWLFDTINTTVEGNEIESCCIYIFEGSENKIIENKIFDSMDAISVYCSNNNVFRDNTILKNLRGIYLNQCINNSVYHNNFLYNSFDAFDTGYGDYLNFWDAGSSIGGNYWHDYISFDAINGMYGQLPYYIPGGEAKDNYPFMNQNGWR